MTRKPTEMELRVAKVLMERAMDYITTPAWAERSWQQTNEGRAHYINTARAAIRAMKSPTTEMLTCGYAAGYAADDGVDEVTEVLAEVVYTAMIRAASPGDE